MVDAENARHHVSQLAKQVVVLQINLVKTQKNNLRKVPPHRRHFFMLDTKHKTLREDAHMRVW